MKIYNKLVRDKIPEIIEASGESCTCKILSEKDYLRMLDVKLNEELAEYQEDKSIEEMADLLEVMQAVVTAHGWTWQQLEQTRAAKAAKRGGFEKKLLLEFVVETEDKASKSKVLCTRISNKQDVIFAQLKKSAIEDYFWIQDNVRNCDVSENAEFQRHFGYFYQMRFVSQAFRKAYFQVFEKAKHTPMSFEAIAEALYLVDEKHQFSFISKMMHTLDTEKPIYDSLVDATVGLHRKASAPMEERLVSDASIIDQLSALYREMTTYEEMQPILKRFEIEFPGKKLSNVKKIDFLLWALGAVDRKEKAGA